MLRRRHQTGCLRKETRSWILYYWADVERMGVIRRMKKSIRVGPNTLSRAEAQRAAEDVLRPVNDGTVLTGKTLADFLPDWRSTVAPTLNPSTVKGIESSFRAHILPVLGKVQLQVLNVRCVQEVVKRMKTQTEKTKWNVVGDLLSVLSAARGEVFGYKVPAINPKALYVSGRASQKGSTLTPEEVKAVLEDVRGTKWELFFLILAFTGLRAGEILGLRVADCDLQQRLIFVRQTAWEGQIIDGAKTEASVNSVPMPKPVADKLVGVKGNLLFPNKNGKPRKRGKIVEDVLHPIFDRVGIQRKGRRIGFHAFRHALASMLVAATNPAVAQRQLRHKDAATTLGIYAHVIGNGHFNTMDQIVSGMWSG